MELPFSCNSSVLNSYHYICFLNIAHVFTDLIIYLLILLWHIQTKEQQLKVVGYGFIWHIHLVQTIKEIYLKKFLHLPLKTTYLSRGINFFPKKNFLQQLEIFKLFCKQKLSYTFLENTNFLYLCKKVKVLHF